MLSTHYIPESKSWQIFSESSLFQSLIPCGNIRQITVKHFTPWNRQVNMICDNFIEINCAIAKPRAKKYRLIINRAISSECVLAWVVLGEAQRWCAIRISGIWDDITQAPFHHIFQRWADGSVAVYIAAPERLSEIFALSQMPKVRAWISK